jgi:AcrR family transcriptional regulator
VPAAKPYHHGNLKEALLASAIELIAATGPRSFTLREVARRAGVSHNAPYRHFRDREDLLAAVATEGFERLTRAMAGGSRRASPVNRLRRCGLAYVNFALCWPQHFAVMFDSSWNQAEYPECAAAGEQCFHTLLGLVRDCQAAKQVPAGDPLKVAYLAWSLVHGISKLANAGQFPWRSKAAVLRFCAFSIQNEKRFGRTI